MDFLNSLIRFSKSHNYLMGKLKLWATEVNNFNIQGRLDPCTYQHCHKKQEMEKGFIGTKKIRL
jgi:hypothetical protein